MKDFSKRGFQIANSTLELKWVYTGFLVFAFIGYFTIALLGVLRVGPGYESIVEHYRGSEDGEVFPRAFGQMLEEAHFHAFIEGVVLLILAHLFAATSVGKSGQRAVIGLAFGSTLADLACPWLIKYLSPAFAALQMTAWIGMEISALILMGVPIYEMWFKGGRKQPGPSDPGKQESGRLRWKR